MNETVARLTAFTIAIALVLLVALAQVWSFDWDWRCLVVRCAIAK